MKTKRLLAALFSMALLVPNLQSCSDDDPPPTDRKPGITLLKPADDAVTEHSVTFEIRTTDADRAAWTILESTAAAPSAAELFQSGTRLTGESPYTVTADNLKAQTAYTIYAAAAKGDAVSEVASEQVTTLEAVLPVARIVLPAVGAIAPYRVTFQIETEGSDRAAWTILESTAAAPSAEELFQSGTQLTGESPYTVTADNLKAQTAYTIYAAAALGDVTGAVVSAEATTTEYSELLTVQGAGKNYVSYHIEVAADAAYRHVVLSKKSFDSFTGTATTDEQFAQMIATMLSIYGQAGSGPADYTLRHLQQRPNSPLLYDVLAGMDYVAMACPTDPTGQQYTGSFQVVEVRTPDPERLASTIDVKLVRLEPDEADFRCTPDAGMVCYYEQIFPKEQVDELLAISEAALETELLTVVQPITQFGELSEWAFLDEKTSYVHCAIGIDAQGDRTAVVKTPFETPALPEVDLTNITLNQVVEADSYGAVASGANDFYLILSDQPAVLDEYGEAIPTVFPCHMLVCDLYSAARADGRIAEGTYRYLVENPDKEIGTLDPIYTFAPYYGETVDEYREFWFESGTIEVAHVDAGYRLTASFTTEDGKPFTATYVGPIEFPDASGAAPQRMLRRAGMPSSSMLRR